MGDRRVPQRWTARPWAEKPPPNSTPTPLHSTPRTSDFPGIRSPDLMPSSSARNGSHSLWSSPPQYQRWYGGTPPVLLASMRVVCLCPGPRSTMRACGAGGNGAPSNSAPCAWR
eukprot:362881-Chlamydomonas_euryale.AAC.3